MKDTSLVNDLFDIHDDFFNHQLFSKLIIKGYFEEVIHLISQQKIDPYKTFKFKKERTRETIFTSLFTEAIASNNVDFIQALLKYKPITKTAMTPLMKKVNLLTMIVDCKLHHSLQALNHGKSLSIMAETCTNPIEVMQKAYITDDTIFSIISKYFPPLLPDYQLFLSIFSNHSKDIVNLDRELITQPLNVFNYYATHHYYVRNRYSSIDSASEKQLSDANREFSASYANYFGSLLSTKLSGELLHSIVQSENCIYATTLALLLNYDEAYCSLYNQLGKEEFKKQESHNQHYFSTLNRHNKVQMEASNIMLERYKLETDLFQINDLNGKKTQRIKT